MYGIAFIVAFGLLGYSVLPTAQTRGDIKPNVIIILTDDQGYGDVGFNGCKDIPTPNIDRIAKNGVTFSKGYASFAVCGPSRAGLITGRYQDRFGFSRNPLFTPNDARQGLPLTEQTMADVLRDAGYRTMAIGKWHLGAHASQHPLKRGFDEFFGFTGGGHRYFPQDWVKTDVNSVRSESDSYKTKLIRNNNQVEEKEYITDAFSREAVEFVKRNDKNPFFLYLAYNAPHAPLQATEKYLSRFSGIKDEKRKTYAAMVSAVDDGVGRLLNQLEQSGQMENTIIFFLSDNGGPHDNGSNNQPLRGHKGSLYDGGIHVPFAMQWKGHVPEGKRYNHPVISLDIFATAIAQAQAKSRNQLDGVNLIPFVTGKNTGTPHDYLFWRQFDRQTMATLNDSIKMINESGTLQLFNVSNDISEKAPFREDVMVERIDKEYSKWNEHNIPPAFYGLLQAEEYDKLYRRQTEHEKNKY